jgi:hypothetical protein
VSSSLELKLREDKWYDRGEFAEWVREGAGITLGNSCLEELFDAVRRFVDGSLRPTVKSLIVKDLDVESPPPTARRDRFNLGQWVGFFEVGGPLCGFDSVTVEVEPKVGWGALLPASPEAWLEARPPRAVCRISARTRTPHLLIGSPS